MATDHLNEALARITKARSQLLLKEDFFGTLATRLVPVEASDKITTAGTDGLSLFFNSTFIKGLSVPECEGLLGHEVLHVSGDHMSRRQNRNPYLWNVATDLVINWMLKESGYALPKGGWLDVQYAGKTPEAIYNLLMEEIQQQGQSIVSNSEGEAVYITEDDLGTKPMEKPPKGGRPCKTGKNAQGKNNKKQWGEILNGPADGSDIEVLQREWKIATKQAAEISKRAGTLPGMFESHLEELDPLVDWRSVLWPFFQESAAADDYDWRKPNRAYISEDEYFPSLYSDVLGKIAIVSDSSGSCLSFLSTFWSEMCAVTQFCRPSETVILSCDTRVIEEDIKVLDENDLLADHEPVIRGGGGTKFRPAFEWLNKHHPDVVACVYLTDLECNDYGPEPEYPVLWVCTQRRYDEPPFGEVTVIEFEEELQNVA